LVKLSKIGAMLGIDYSAVSISRNRLQASLSGSPQLRAILERVVESAGRGKEAQADKTG
jgi:hypothetical protein